MHFITAYICQILLYYIVILFSASVNSKISDYVYSQCLYQAVARQLFSLIYRVSLRWRLATFLRLRLPVLKVGRSSATFWFWFTDICVPVKSSPTNARQTNAHLIYKQPHHVLISHHASRSVLPLLGLGVPINHSIQIFLHLQSVDKFKIVVALMSAR